MPDTTAGASIPEVSHHHTLLNDTDLHYVSAGSDGTPVLLVHGFPETWWAFHKLIPLVAAEHRVIAVDLPGFGDSGKAPEDSTSATAAETLRRLIDELDLGAVHLTGQDISGVTTFRLAAVHPELVRSFAAIETGLPGFGLEMLADVTHGGTWHIGVLAAPGIPEMLLAGREREFLAGYAYPAMCATDGAITDQGRPLPAPSAAPARRVRVHRRLHPRGPRMTTPDIRAFYAALGIELPGWPKLEAPVCCFAQPDVHNRADRSPSCSVNLLSGAWNCHGCGARGGAYDAALATGHTPRSAIDLMIAHGLAEPRVHLAAWRTDRRPAVTAPKASLAAPSRPRLAAGEADVRSWADTLDADGRMVRRLIMERAWAPRIMRALHIGFDGARITIPIREADGEPRGILRYDAFGPREPKMRAAVGSRLGLIPHPACERFDHLILVEGPPDMIAARSAGLPAIAIPGTNAWHPGWAPMLMGKRVTIVMDCDAPGRRAAEAISSSLAPFARRTDVIDLWPDRNDGYDLTDRILEWRLVKRDRPRAFSTVGLLLAPHPTYRPRGAEHHPPRSQGRRA